MHASSTGWRRTNYVMTGIFLLSAVVQLNDPDPLLWTLLYLVAAGVTFVEARRGAPWSVTLVLALGTLVWGLGIASRVLGVVPFGDMFLAFEMRDAGIEESREMYGLWIVSTWMAVITIRTLRRRSLQ